MGARRMTRSLVALVAAGVLLGGCLPFRWPTAAVTSAGDPAASAATASSSAGTPSPSPSRTPSPTPTQRGATDPFAGKRVDLMVGYTETQQTALPCGSVGSGLGTARAGGYAGFANQEAAGVFDLVSGNWLWCVKTGFGGVDGVVEVTTDSAVGRPGYQPGLDADTLEAAKYDSNSSAFFLQAGAQTLLVVPVTIDRPQIGSQKEAPLRGLVAFDGHGVKKWAVGLPQEREAKVFCRPAATACLVQQGSGSDAVVVSPDAETGELSTILQGGVLRTDALPGPAGSELIVFNTDRYQPMWARYEADAQWNPLTVSGGKAAGSSSYLGVVDHWVVMGDESNLQAKKIRLIDTTTGANEVVPFDFFKDSCVPLDGWQMVCRDDSSKPSIGVVDLASGGVVWEWREDDPDPVTGVPRKVPRSLFTYGDLIVANPGDSARYLIDAATGMDVKFDPKMLIAFDLLRSDACNAYGCVTSSSGGFGYARAK